MHESYYFQQGLRDVIAMFQAKEEELGMSEDTLKLVVTTAEPFFQVFDRVNGTQLYVGDDEGLIAWLNSPKPE